MTETVKAFDVLDVVVLLNYRIDHAGSQKAVAEQAGISPQYLNDVVHFRRDPGRKVLEWLGLERRVVYVEREA